MVTYTCGETYIFDLDKPINIRYQSLFPKYVPLIRKYCQTWISVSQPSQERLDQLSQLLKVHSDKELVEYCEYIGEQCDIDSNIILYMQYMYDLGFDDSLSMGCTSILVNPEGCVPYLVRNLDWDFNDIIRGLTINAIYIQNNQIVTNHLAIVAQLVIPHTIKNNYFAISLNFLWPEYTLEQQWHSLLQDNKIASIGRLIYKLSFSKYAYSDLSQVLSTVLVQHHGLLNVIGNQTGQCSIFYINDWSKKNKYQLQQEINQQEQYIFSTNGDYFEFSIERYQAAKTNLQKLSIEQLREPKNVVQSVALKYPNYNETTIFTTILDCNPKSEFIIYRG